MIFSSFDNKKPEGRFQIGTGLQWLMREGEREREREGEGERETDRQTVDRQVDEGETDGRDR